MTFLLIAAAVSLVACFGLGWISSRVVAVVRPSYSVPVLTLASLVAAAAAGVALSAIAVAAWSALTSVAGTKYDAAVVHAEVPVPGWLGLIAGTLVLLLLYRTAVRLVRTVGSLRRADRLSRRLRAGVSDGSAVVMIDDDSADAYTVAGVRGCVVISRQLFTALPTPDRSVIVAHEFSHLRRRHHLYVHAADLAAAANPLLRAVPAAVRLGVERWADEDAAVGVGDRRLVGRALARVALLRHALRAVSPSVEVQQAGVRHAAAAGDRADAVGGRHVLRLGATTMAVAVRVEALLRPPAARRPARLALMLLIALGALIVGVSSLDQVRDVVEAATR